MLCFQIMAPFIYFMVMAELLGESPVIQLQ